MSGVMGPPVAEKPVDRLFDAMDDDYGLPAQFWKHDIANTDELALAVKVLMPLDCKGVEKAIDKGEVSVRSCPSGCA